MMRIFLITTILLFSIQIFGQEKALGDIKFGMSKKELKEACKANPDKNRINIVGTIFIPAVGMGFSLFQNNKLCRLDLMTYGYDADKKKQNLTHDAAKTLLIAIKKVFNDAGYIDEYINPSWPAPIFMKDETGVILTNKEKTKYIEIAIRNRGGLYNIGSQTMNTGILFPPEISIYSKEYYESIKKKAVESLKKSTEEIKEKL